MLDLSVLLRAECNRDFWGAWGGSTLDICSLGSEDTGSAGSWRCWFGASQAVRAEELGANFLKTSPCRDSEQPVPVHLPAGAPGAAVAGAGSKRQLRGAKSALTEGTGQELIRQILNGWELGTNTRSLGSPSPLGSCPSTTASPPTAGQGGKHPLHPPPPSSSSIQAMGGRKGQERGGSSAEEQNRQCYKEPRAATGARGHPRCEAKRLFPGQAGEARRKRDRGEGKRGQPWDVCPSPRRFVRLPSVSGMKAALGPLPASSSAAGIAFVWLVASSLRREGGIYIKKKGIAKTKRKKKGKPTTTQNAAPAPTPPPHTPSPPPNNNQERQDLS